MPIIDLHEGLPQMGWYCEHCGRDYGPKVERCFHCSLPSDIKTPEDYEEQAEGD